MSDLRKRRVACGLSQEDLAELASVSTSTIRNAETGRVEKPRLTQRIEQALTDYESGPGPTEIGLTYRSFTGTSYHLDHEDLPVEDMPKVDREIAKALLRYALKRLEDEAKP